MARPTDSQPTTSEPLATEPGTARPYQPPTVTELGSVRELTRGSNQTPDPDNMGVGESAG